MDCQEKNEVTSDFFHRLRKAREIKGLSQREVGDLIGVKHNQISQWENGQRPRPSRISALAKIYGVSIEWLNGSPSSTTPASSIGDVIKLDSECGTMINQIGEKRLRESAVRALQIFLEGDQPAYDLAAFILQLDGRSIKKDQKKTETIDHL